ncbi:MAG TPA: hypothetical protein VK498_06200 [Ferruginibacter sp.]|nr:hypothetical protein [Ferruginibacter sp.]
MPHDIAKVTIVKKNKYYDKSSKITTHFWYLQYLCRACFYHYTNNTVSPG